MESKTRLGAKSSLQSTRSLKSKSSLKTGAPSLLKAGKKSPKPKAVSITQLKKLADKFHSLATRYRFATRGKDNEWYAECITCKNTYPLKKLHCGHFMSRSHNITRYDEYNTAPQCYGCNVMQQGRQYQFSIEIDLLYGDGTAKELLQRCKTAHQFTPEELLEVIHDAKEQILWYENN